MQLNLCKNCEHTFNGNFCSNCGQKTNTKRLDSNFLKDELKYTFLHINKGLLYTSKQLFVRPGETIKDFIDGKRIQHYKPILLVFVLAGIEGLLFHYLHLEKVLKTFTKGNDVKNSELSNSIFQWITSHNAVVELILIPLISICSWLAFKKWGYNYIENIIINCFATAQRLLISILLFPVSYYLSTTNYFIIVSGFVSLLGYAATIWVYYKIYEKQNIGDVILRIVLFLFLMFVILSLFFIIVMVILMFYLVKTGQLKP